VKRTERESVCDVCVCVLFNEAIEMVLESVIVIVMMMMMMMMMMMIIA
jgi:hypothetical protein